MISAVDAGCKAHLRSSCSSWLPYSRRRPRPAQLKKRCAATATTFRSRPPRRCRRSAPRVSSPPSTVISRRISDGRPISKPCSMIAAWSPSGSASNAAPRRRTPRPPSRSPDPRRCRPRARTCARGRHGRGPRSRAYREDAVARRRPPPSGRGSARALRQRRHVPHRHEVIGHAGRPDARHVVLEADLGRREAERRGDDSFAGASPPLSGSFGQSNSAKPPAPSSVTPQRTGPTFSSSTMTASCSPVAEALARQADRRADRRMPGEGQLPRRREDADARGMRRRSPPAARTPSPTD